MNHLIIFVILKRNSLQVWRRQSIITIHQICSSCTMGFLDLSLLTEILNYFDQHLPNPFTPWPLEWPFSLLLQVQFFLTLQMSYFHVRAQGSQSVTDSEAYPAPQHMCTLTHSPPPPTLNQPRYFKPCFDLLCISVTLFLSVFIFIFFFRWWAHCFEPSGSTFPLPLTFLHASVTSRHVAQSRLDGLHRSGSFAVAGGHRLSHLCSSTLSPASAGERWNSSCFFWKQLSSAIWCGGETLNSRDREFIPDSNTDFEKIPHLF